MLKVDLTKEGFHQEFDRSMDLQLVVQFKLGAASLEQISPLKSVEVSEGILYVENFNSPYRYKYLIKEVRYAMVMFPGQLG